MIFHQFGQVGEIRRLGGTRFWRVWQLESVRRRRPAPEQREASPPPHTQKSESRPRRPFVECLGVGGVPHQLDGGGRVRVLHLCRRDFAVDTHTLSLCSRIFAFRSVHFFRHFGHLGELVDQGRGTVRPFGQLWRSERVFSSLWASRGSGQRYREAVWAALAVGARVFVNSVISGSRAEVP